MHWKPSPAIVSISEKIVHLWQVNLQVTENKLQTFESWLSEDEMAKANRFHLPEHRRRYIVTRGTLRQLLGCYLRDDPSKIEFTYTQKGKPLILAPQRTQKLHFNVSHSEEKALYAIACPYLVGVDLEKIRLMKDLIAIAQRFFTPEEVKLIEALDSQTQLTTFFQLWTAKEAYLKATGVGISGGLDQVPITWNKGNIESCHPLWHLISFPLPDNYLGAMAIQGQDYDLQAFLG